MTTGKITLTERAAGRIRDILSTEPGKQALRIAVSGGGCSGFQYEFELEGATAGDDLVIERDGARVVIDSTSIMYLLGSEIDFIDNLMGAQFAINNPNATSSCGCGTSFSV